MFKLIMLIKKRPDLTREQFIDYYDNRHVPFMHSLLPKGAAVHRRNYVRASPAPEKPGLTQLAEEDTWDVISEVFYEDLATAQAAIASMNEPHTKKMMEDDENNFILTGSIRRYVVEVHETVYRSIEGSKS
jgi:hypothetical protein